jgi:hypothetical protein
MDIGTIPCFTGVTGVGLCICLRSYHYILGVVQRDSWDLDVNAQLTLAYVQCICLEKSHAVTNIPSLV